MIKAPMTASVEITPTTPQAIFTVCSFNYLPQAQVFIQSVAAAADRYVVVCEQDPGPARREEIARRLGCHVLFLEDLGLPRARIMAFQYDVTELNTSVKPGAFARLFAAGYARVLYFDPDIECYAPLDGLFAQLEQADALVTPHLLKPLPSDGRGPSNEDVLRSGQFNFGFVGLSNTKNGLDFVDFWMDRLENNCIFHHQHYYFVDQFYGALLASFAERLVIARDPGLNLAYWNLPVHGPLACVNSQWRVEGRPLVFFHYSGFAAEDLPRVSRHQDRYRLPDDSPILPLLIGYRDRLSAARARFADLDQSYSFGRYADGTPIPPEDRHRVLLADPAVKSGLVDPFQGLGALAQTNPVPPWPVSRAEFEAQRHRRAEAEAEAEAQSADLAALRHELDQVRAQLQATTQAYQSVLASTAWKVTAPLRRMLALTRRG